MDLACILGLSCTKEKAAIQLSEYLNLSEATPEELQKILDYFILVPHTIQPVTPSGDPVPVFPTNRRLMDLHQHISEELPAILQEAGYAV